MATVQNLIKFKIQHFILFFENLANKRTQKNSILTSRTPTKKTCEDKNKNKNIELALVQNHPCLTHKTNQGFLVLKMKNAINHIMNKYSLDRTNLCIIGIIKNTFHVLVKKQRNLKQRNST